MYEKCVLLVLGWLVRGRDNGNRLSVSEVPITFFTPPGMMNSPFEMVFWSVIS